MKINKIVSSLLLVLLFALPTSAQKKIDRRSLIVYAKGAGPAYLRPNISKALVKELLNANGDSLSTTSSRLENKRVVLSSTLDEAMADLQSKGYVLEEREAKNLEPGAKAGTFTIYGSSLKFVESGNFAKGSVKLRARVYINKFNGKVRRSDITSNSAFLEIKIKNPYPEYPQSVHKYRLMMPDKDVLALLTSDPSEQEIFNKLIERLKRRAHKRDKKRKKTMLINAMFDQIRVASIAEPLFIKPKIAITYYRVAKKYNEPYIKQVVEKKRFRRSKRRLEIRNRNYQITIDEQVKAFSPDFSVYPGSLNIDHYFSNDGNNKYLITAYPSDIRVVEFKQPNEVGYDGPGVIRKPRAMGETQAALWQAFVGDLDEKIVSGSTKDRGKFSHIKRVMREHDL